MHEIKRLLDAHSVKDNDKLKVRIFLLNMLKGYNTTKADIYTVF